MGGMKYAKQHICMAEEVLRNVASICHANNKVMSHSTDATVKKSAGALYVASQRAYKAADELREASKHI
jgi:hypothetical protein